MEPERQIEKLLRAFARKRRNAPGDAFKLHPSVRRRLQTEVEKQFAESDAEESVSLWQFFRQQWAFVLVFAGLLFLGASLFVPALGKAKSKAKSAVAMSHLKQIGTAAEMAAAENNGRLPVTLDALTNGLLTKETLKDPVSDQPFVYVAGGELLDDLATNAVLAYSPAEKKRRAVLLADGTVEMMDQKTFAAADRSGLVQRVRQTELARNEPVATAAPAAVLASGTTQRLGAERKLDETALAYSATTTNFIGTLDTRAATDSDKLLGGAASATGKMDSIAMNSVGSAVNGQKQMFKAKLEEAPTNANLSQRFNQAPKDAANSPVLSTFEVQQNGNAIAVVDRDGSVYQGYLEPEPTTAGIRQLETALPALTNQNLANNQANQSTFFRVSGQNRTLNQNVVFNGNFIQNTANLSASNAPQQLLFNNAGIAGIVVIGQTNEMKIEATPAIP